MPNVYTVYTKCGPVEAIHWVEASNITEANNAFAKKEGFETFEKYCETNNPEEVASTLMEGSPPPEDVEEDAPDTQRKAHFEADEAPHNWTCSCGNRTFYLDMGDVSDPKPLYRCRECEKPCVSQN